MSNKNSNIDIFGSGSGGSFNIRQFLNKMLFHWPLFVIFFVVFFVLAFFYLKYVKPAYDIHATVLIKDQTYRRRLPALEELDLVEAPKDPQAEIGVMNSVSTVGQIVVDLQLWITYQQKNKYHSYRDIYETTPVQFKLLQRGRNFADDGDQLDITIQSQDYFLLKQSGKKFKRLAFKDNFINSFGKWRLDVTDNLKRYIGKTIRITLNNPRDLTSYYQGAIFESVGLKTPNVVDIAIQDEVPSRGRAILNDLLRVYMDASVESKRESGQNTLKFVDQRLTSITRELNNAESKVQTYRSSNNILETQSQGDRYLSNAQNTDSRINEINIKLSVLDEIERYINSPKGADNPPATGGLDDAGLQGLIRQLTDLQMQKTRLLATLPESNPLFNPINQQINVTRTALHENITGIRSSLQSTKQQLQALGSGYQSSIRNLPGQERDLSDIRRMKEIKESLYTYLLQKKEQLSLDYASTIPDAIIINRANGGLRVWPVAKSVYAIALLLALILPTGILYGRDAIKNRILNRSEIISATGMPVLSEIDENTDNNNAIVVLNQNSYIGEQFRDLRTKFNYLHGKPEKGKGKITLFTSSIAGEGKSFIKGNLGSALSVSGKKVILVELDLRRPTFAGRYKLDKLKPGISDFLIGNATKAQIIQPIELTENLFSIHCGTVPPNPSELLESDELATLLKDLRSEYDHILLDSPPIHLLTDAMILAPMCDLTLYVIRQDYTPKRELSFISELNKEKKFPRLNLIFNGIVKEKHGERYGYQKNSYYIRYPKKFKTQVKRFFTRF
ncbi:MAG TPA: polysaccharide biosynthesis tyrosine autokinase [Mucilaginibacter sp.]|jgi:capsular exopolysaccharide synthesis family protein